MSAYDVYFTAAVTICAVSIDTTYQHYKLAAALCRAQRIVAAVPWHAAWLQSCWPVTLLWQALLPT